MTKQTAKKLLETLRFYIVEKYPDEQILPVLEHILKYYRIGVVRESGKLDKFLGGGKK